MSNLINRHEAVASGAKIDGLATEIARWNAAKPFPDWLQTQQLVTYQSQANVINAMECYAQNAQTTRSSIHTILEEKAKFQPWSVFSGSIIDPLLSALSFKEMLDREERIPDNLLGTFD